MTRKVEKSLEEWAKTLTATQFRVTREKGTEAPFSGKYNGHKADGTYVCVCCGEPLFESEHKFDSGCGWPSFYKPATDTGIEEEADNSLGMQRTEVVCDSCGAHLGHVFPDGPPDKTGLRYCINSASLDFKERK